MEVSRWSRNEEGRVYVCGCTHMCVCVFDTQFYIFSWRKKKRLMLTHREKKKKNSFNIIYLLNFPASMTRIKNVMSLLMLASSHYI